MALGKTPKSARAQARPTVQRAQPKTPKPQPASATKPGTAEGLLGLQQTVGNQALQRLLVGQGIQPKLQVGPASDVYEQEADRVASQVVNTADPVTAGTDLGANKLVAQPKPASSGSSSGGTTASSGLEGAVNSSKGGGGSLPEQTRAYMENRFGADFSNVRIHADHSAAQLNRSIQSDAFTHGSDIYFNSNKYDPGSQPGKQLLAHELTHVVQQGGTSQASGLQRKTNITVQNRLPANRVSTKKQKMYLDFVRMKRLNPQFSKIIGSKLGIKKLEDKGGGEHSGGAYGHWWTEIGDMEGDYPGTWTSHESYGWWPKKALRGKLSRVFGGVPGELNSGDGNKDPHHGEDVGSGKTFHPVMEVDTNADYQAVRDKVVGDIRKKAKAYRGKWQWVFGWGQNCHTFQQWLKKEVGIHNQKGVGWLKRPDNVEGLAEAAKKQEEEEQREKFNQANPGRDFKLTEDIKVSTPNTDDQSIDIPKDAVVRILEFEGIDYDKILDWNKVNISWGGKTYECYKEDVTKHGTQI